MVGRLKARWLLRGLLALAVLVVAVISAFAALPLLRETETAGDLVPATGRFVDAGDLQLFVQTEGDSAGTPLLLVHGMAAWSETWRPVMQAMAAAGYFVIAVDLPPFGFSQRPKAGGLGRQKNAARLAKVIDAVAGRPAIIVGHSFGSRAIAETAMQYPEKVQAMVLVSAALDRIYKDRAKLQGAGEAAPSHGGGVAYELLSLSPLRHLVTSLVVTNPMMADTLLGKFVHDPTVVTPQLTALYQRPSTLQNSTKDMGLWLQYFVSGQDLGRSSKRGNFGKLSMPTHLIWGTEDRITPITDGRRLKSFLPHARLSEMQNVGHMPHIEKTGRFIELLKAALKPVRDRDVAQLLRGTLQ